MGTCECISPYVSTASMRSATINYPDHSDSFLFKQLELWGIRSDSAEYLGNLVSIAQ